VGVEIERKFLLRGDAGCAGEPVFSQGYLSSHKERVVRVRIEGERAVMTIKGANKGATRGEWEYEIPSPTRRAAGRLVRAAVDREISAPHRVWRQCGKWMSSSA
jgi:CYTH domain-containing protein